MVNGRILSKQIAVDHATGTNDLCAKRSLENQKIQYEHFNWHSNVNRQLESFINTVPKPRVSVSGDITENGRGRSRVANAIVQHFCSQESLGINNVPNCRQWFRAELSQETYGLSVGIGIRLIN